MANHPYAVQILYKDGSRYFVFCENEIYSKNLQHDFEESINQGIRIARYYDTDPIAQPPTHSILVSLENVLEIRIVAKSIKENDMVWEAFQHEPIRDIHHRRFSHLSLDGNAEQ